MEAIFHRALTTTCTGCDIYLAIRETFNGIFLLCKKHQLLTGKLDFHPPPVGEFTTQPPLRERVLDMALDGAPKGTGPVCGVIPLLAQPYLGAVINFQGDTTLTH